MTRDEHCNQFLKNHRLLASQYDYKEILKSFWSEMEKGLKGEDSSLKMIPSYISIPDSAPKNKKIIVLDAGGTNFRTAVINFDEESNTKIEYFEKYPMPGIKKEYTKEEFFNQIAEYLRPVLDESDQLSFCFSYATKIDSQRDGTLLVWTKEIKAPEVVGEKILANIGLALKEKGLPCPKTMLIMNDTIASLLAGVTATKFSKEFNYIGFILGTGTNCSYIEINSSITKEEGLIDNQKQAINVESANFNKIERGDIDIAYDNTTNNPGQYVLEKMISGGYIGNLCYKILSVASSEGLLSETTMSKLEKRGTIDEKALNTILEGLLSQQPDFEDCSNNDLITIKTIISEVVERAALLTATNMAAAIIKSSNSSDIKKFCVSADGSVYYKLYSFRERAEKYLAEILLPYNIEIKIVKINDAPLIGAAVAGLSI